jgi:hypothetical protein
MSVPVPPVRDARTTRYKMTVLRLAAELHEGGWTPTQIRGRLHAELGVRPAVETIRCWVEPGFREFRRCRLNEQAARRREAAREPRPTPDPFTVPESTVPELTDEVMWALRVEDGLSHEAIARVARRFFAVELSSHGVRRWLDRLGAPKNPLKARPPRVREMA